MTNKSIDTRIVSTIIYVISLIWIDLVSKYLFYDLELLNNIFLAVANHGISYNMLSGQTIYIIWITLIILIATTYMYQKKIITQLAYILVISWWMWNLIDRLYYWFVRDFIHVGNRFPVFNIADVLIFFWCLIIFFIIWNIPQDSMQS